MDALSTLRHNPLLVGFSDDGIRIILSAVVARSIAVDEPLFLEGSIGEGMFFVVAGELSATCQRNGGRIPLGLVRAPEAVGEMALSQPGPRRATLVATTTVNVFELTRRDFVGLQAQRPQACLKLLMNIHERTAKRAADAAADIARAVGSSSSSP